MNISDSDTESFERYSRTILLENMNEEKQEMLKRSKVLVIGCGALGSISSMYLAGSGVGHIGIVDFDTIGISNLQRQLSFTEADIDRKKTEALATRLRGINSEIRIEPIDCVLNRENAREIMADYDFIVEGSDNPATKYLISDLCKEMGKACCIGGVAQYKGQVLTQTRDSLTYRDVFPESAKEGEYKPCSTGGVFGPLPGIVASVQACETIKYICEVGELLTNRLFMVDALNMTFHVLKIG